VSEEVDLFEEVQVFEEVMVEAEEEKGHPTDKI
jgi:hypothetical protein